MNSKTFYITTPIYYVNDIPHIGHFYTTLACDVIARYKRLEGYNVVFTTGTDEHGIKIENKAKSLNLSPQTLVDDLSKTFIDLFNNTDITYDKFIRTTNKTHQENVINIWNILTNKGYIYKGIYEGYYSISDEAFYTKSDLTTNKNGNLVSLSSGSLVTNLTEESYFFKLSNFQNKLLEYYDTHPDFVEPKEKYNEVKSFVKRGLKDLSVSRLKVKWGIKVPNNPDHTIYVWLDALTSYLTGARYSSHTKEEFTSLWPADLHMVGKDILKFHAIYWPAFLIALDLPLPKKIFAHGWWTNNKQKISKSLGNAINPIELINSYGLDEIKYFLLKEIPFGNDGDFNINSLVKRINNELVNEYGNLCHRTLTIIYNHLNQHVSYDNTTNNKLNEFNYQIKSFYNKSIYLINKQLFHIYIDNLWQIIRNLNIYINNMAPWKLIKENFISEANKCLYTITTCIKDISLLLLPFIPRIANKALQQLNHKELTFNNIGNLEKEYYITNKPEPLVKKIILKY